jgi:hypothetical protein
LLLGVLREALGDVDTVERLEAFTATRREALTQILDRARSRGQIAAPASLDALVDQAFGLLWYRMIFAHRPLDERAADDVTAILETQLGADQEG